MHDGDLPGRPGGSPPVGPQPYADLKPFRLPRRTTAEQARSSGCVLHIPSGARQPRSEESAGTLLGWAAADLHGPNPRIRVLPKVRVRLATKGVTMQRRIRIGWGLAGLARGATAVLRLVAEAVRLWREIVGE
jgi:hypothetical protein